MFHFVTVNNISWLVFWNNFLKFFYLNILMWKYKFFIILKFLNDYFKEISVINIRALVIINITGFDSNEIDRDGAEKVMY